MYLYTILRDPYRPSIRDSIGSIKIEKIGFYPFIPEITDTVAVTSLALHMDAYYSKQVQGSTFGGFVSSSSHGSGYGSYTSGSYGSVNGNYSLNHYGTGWTLNGYGGYIQRR